MKITVEFDSEEEFKARIKNPRGAGKGSSDDNDNGPQTGGNQAPPPMMPPQGAPSFNPQPQTFAPGGAPSFSPPAGPTMDPAVAGLVQRISAKIDAAVNGGQPVDSVTNWFRQQCGAEAANATLDQIKGVFLPKLAMPALENIAKLMNA